MAWIKITLVKGLSGHPKTQHRTVSALGLGKVNSSVEKEANPAILGMVRSVEHLVAVENIDQKTVSRKTEVRKKKSEDRSQKTEAGKKKTEDRSQKAESGKKKTEDRSQKTEKVKK